MQTTSQVSDSSIVEKAKDTCFCNVYYLQVLMAAMAWQTGKINQTFTQYSASITMAQLVWTTWSGFGVLVLIIKWLIQLQSFTGIQQQKGHQEQATKLISND